MTSYYALLPGDTTDAWNRLTPAYQSSHAKGRAAYDRFWGAMRKVAVHRATGSPPDHARALITYYYRDGRVVDEVTSFGLAQQDGLLKIASSTVDSSVTR